MSKNETFIQAIREKRVVEIEANTHEKGLIKRTCVPFDYGPSRGNLPRGDRYHFWDIDSPDGAHNLSLLPEQLTEIKMTDKRFEPGDYVSWKPNWFVPRDWGDYS